MTIQNRILFAGLCFLLSADARAQDKNQEKLPVKFGKVTPEDFNINVAALDTSAGAVVVADYGTSTFEGNREGWFDIVYKHSCRIKILKKSGFDAATITIPLYDGDKESEKLEGLKASTYNVESGQVLETKLDDKSIYSTRSSKHITQKKFTFPALKEGSIVEYTYTQTSPFIFNLQPWIFQGEYPCLWSEYQVEIPDFFRYATLAQGYLSFNSNTSTNKNQYFTVSIPGQSGVESLNDNVVTHRWVIENVPAFNIEPYTTTPDNYKTKIEFQLASYNFPNGYNKQFLGNWLSISKALLEDDDFGGDLDHSNGWMEDEIKTIIQGAKDPKEKAQRIYAFVRDHFKCTAHNDLSLSDPLKTVFKNRRGNEADINLLLIAMLRHEKITADPVILSTRDNGFVNQLYPLLDRFNYVIGRVTIDSSHFFLDASEPWLTFSKVPARCYNGYARLLNKDLPAFLSLDADSLQEKKMTLVILTKGDKGGLEGRFTTTPGFNEICDLREKLKPSSQGDFLKDIRSSYTSEYTVSNLEIDSLQRPDDPLQLAYDLKIIPDSTSDLFYFNPMLDKGYKTNPFVSADRRYPVEMAHTMDETYSLNMEVPDGFDVDELPKQAKVLFNNDEGFFEYLVVRTGDMIQFRSRIKLNKANFKPEDYATLRDFFAYIVKKQSEQIVFKKKKSA